MDICFLEALKKKNNKKRKSEGDGLYKVKIMKEKQSYLFKVSWKICLKERDRQKIKKEDHNMNEIRRHRWNEPRRKNRT